MLIEDACGIATEIVGEYSRSGIISIIQEVANLLAFRGTQNEGAYSTSIRPVRDRITSIVSTEPPVLRTRRVLSFADRVLAANVLPADFARKLLVLAQPTIAQSGVSSEATALKSDADSILKRLETFLGTSRFIGYKPIQLPHDKLVVGILTPVSSFGGDLSRLGTLLEDFDHLFGDAVELATGERRKPSYAYCSTSSFNIWQYANSETAVHILNVIKACYDTARSRTEFKKLTDTMRQAGVNDDVIAQAKSEIEKRSEENLERDLISDVQHVSEGAEPGRKNELKSSIVFRAKAAITWI